MCANLTVAQWRANQINRSEKINYIHHQISFIPWIIRLLLCEFSKFVFIVNEFIHYIFFLLLQQLIWLTSCYFLTFHLHLNGTIACVNMQQCYWTRNNLLHSYERYTSSTLKEEEKKGKINKLNEEMLHFIFKWH